MFGIKETYIKDMVLMHLQSILWGQIESIGIEKPNLDIELNLFRNKKILIIEFANKVDANLFRVSGVFSDEELLKQIDTLMRKQFGDTVDEVMITHKRRWYNIN